MTDDLVKRLRERSRQYVDNEYNFDKQAADRIQKLEAALREVISVSDRKTDIYDRAKAALASAGVTERLMPDPHAGTGTDEKDAVLVPQEGSSNG